MNWSSGSASTGNAVEITHNIYRIAVPMPFAGMEANVYVIDDDPLTLIDAGPNTIAALRALEFGLSSIHHRIEDVGLVLITHQHIDHVGLVSEIVRRSHARVGCLHNLAPHMQDYHAFSRRDERVIRAEMAHHGVDAVVITAFQAFFSLRRYVGSSFDVDHRLRSGDTVELSGRSLRVWHRPGHSPSDTVFHDEESGVMLGGDHLLRDVSSNPLISAPLESSEGDQTPRRPPALVAYLRSLDETRRMRITLVAGGHGELVWDHDVLIEQRLALHAERAENIRTLLKRPRTAHEVAIEIWGDDAFRQVYLTLSEALAHIELLSLRGAVVAEDSDPVRFVAT